MSHRSGLAHVIRTVLVIGLGLVPAFAHRAEAQTLGLGPHFSFVRGDATAVTSTRYSGGLLRLRSSPRTAIELSFDVHSVLNDSLTERVKDMPIHASLLLYPVRTTFSPYLLGGIGWYRQRIDQMQGDSVLGSTSVRKTGYHAGIGGEIWIGRRATVHADYRYTFLGMGDDEAGSEPGAVPIPGLGFLQDRLNLSHKGSMWTSGVMLYF